MFELHCVNFRRSSINASRWLTKFAGIAAIVFCVSGFGVESKAQSIAPFSRLAGQWSGSGSIELSNGRREPIRCRASYDVLGDRRQLQLNIRCASDSYNFDLMGEFSVDGQNQVAGRWTERTRSVGGTAVGNSSGDRLQLHVESSGFAAELVMVTKNKRQSVTIDSHGGGQVVKASISLNRS